MKHCNKCNTDKPLESFAKSKYNPDGLNYVCKDCFKKTYSAEAKQKEAKKKATKKAQTKRRLEKAPPPEIDVILHAASVRAANELNSISAHKELNTAEVGRMKSLIDILLLIRKNARPRKNDNEEQINTEDLF